MGRYYSGDIEGKFWFAVQSSDDASYFGADPETPDYLQYHFTEDDLPNVKKGIKNCLKELGEYKKKIDNFFKDNGGYNDEKLAMALDVDTGKVKHLLEWYARHELGQKIAKCIEKTGQCAFDAEL